MDYSRSALEKVKIVKTVSIAKEVKIVLTLKRSENTEKVKRSDGP